MNAYSKNTIIILSTTYFSYLVANSFRVACNFNNISANSRFITRGSFIFLKHFRISLYTKVKNEKKSAKRSCVRASKNSKYVLRIFFYLFACFFFTSLNCTFFQILPFPFGLYAFLNIYDLFQFMLMLQSDVTKLDSGLAMKPPRQGEPH